MQKSIQRLLIAVVSLILLMGVLPLSIAADYPTWDGSAKTVTMKAGEEIGYIYTPAVTGPYTISQSTSVIHTSFEQADFNDKDAEPIPVDVEGKANGNDACYRLKGGVRYLVKMSMSSAHTEWPDGLSDTISIYAGEPKKEVDLCTPFPADGALTLTVKPGEEHKYKFTPTESGRYVLYGGNSIVNIRLRHGTDSLDMPDNQLIVANPFGTLHGYMAEMTAGETYIMTFSMWENENRNYTDTYYLQKVGTMQSAELRSAYAPSATVLYGYVGSRIQLFPYTQPLYHEIFTTHWTVSDPTVAQFVSTDGQRTRELELKKPGVVTVTATVDGVAVSETITVKDRPVLKLDESLNLSFGGSVGVQCAFTPAESGTYYFHMVGAGGTTTILDTDYATYWQDKGTLSASLSAGKTYILEGAFGPKNYTITVSRGSNNTLTNPSQDPSDPSETTPSDTNPSTDKDTHKKVPIHYENGKGHVRYEDVASLLDSNSGNTLTVTVEEDTVHTVALPTKLLTEAAATNSTLRVELPHATVVLDAAILTRAAQAAAGDAVELSAQMVDTATLSEQQQKTLQNKLVAGVLRLQLTGGATIHELGGTAAITIPFTPEADKKLKDYTVYYLTEEGDLKKMKTLVGDDSLTFLTTHFSDYSVMYEPPKASDKKHPDVGLVVTAMVIALLLVAGGVVAVILLFRKKELKKSV